MNFLKTIVLLLAITLAVVPASAVYEEEAQSGSSEARDQFTGEVLVIPGYHLSCLTDEQRESYILHELAVGSDPEAIQARLAELDQACGQSTSE